MSKTSAADLTDRIATAVQGTVTSDEVNVLIGEVEQARAAAYGQRAAARARALDPVTGADAAASARQEADDFCFEWDRLGTALEALQNSHREAKEREKDARRRAVYEAAKAERDSLAEELREVYPGIERRLVCLMGRIAANNETLETVNRNLPACTSQLSSSEEIARPGHSSYEYAMHQLTRCLRLPRFQVDKREPNAWPTSKM